MIGITAFNIMVIIVNLGMYIWVWQSLNQNEATKPSIRYTKLLMILFAINMLVMVIPMLVLQYMMSFSSLPIDGSVFAMVSQTTGMIGVLMAMIGVGLMIYGIYKESLENEKAGFSDVE